MPAWAHGDPRLARRVRVGGAVVVVPGWARPSAASGLYGIRSREKTRSLISFPWGRVGGGRERVWGLGAGPPKATRGAVRAGRGSRVSCGPWGSRLRRRCPAKCGRRRCLFRPRAPPYPPCRRGTGRPETGFGPSPYLVCVCVCKHLCECVFTHVCVPVCLCLLRVQLFSVVRRACGGSTLLS